MVNGGASWRASREAGREFASRAWEHIASSGYTPFSPEYPWRSTRDPYQLFLAEYLLRKTTSRQVSAIYNHLVNHYPSFCTLAGADFWQLLSLLRPLGLHSRVQKLLEAAQYVCTNLGGHLPADRDALLSIPGVGPYTAGAILCFSFGKRVPVVDTGIARFWARYSTGAPSRIANPHRDPRAWEASAAYIENFPRIPELGNYFLLDFSRTYCTAAKPRCAACPFGASCLWFCGSKLAPPAYPA